MPHRRPNKDTAIRIYPHRLAEIRKWPSSKRVGAPVIPFLTKEVRTAARRGEMEQPYLPLMTRDGALFRVYISGGGPPRSAYVIKHLGQEKSLSFYNRLGQLLVVQHSRGTVDFHTLKTPAAKMHGREGIPHLARLNRDMMHRAGYSDILLTTEDRYPFRIRLGGGSVKDAVFTAKAKHSTAYYDKSGKLLRLDKK